MKKLILIVVLVVLGIAGYEYYQRYQPQIERLKDSFQNGDLVSDLKTQVFTPGGLRATVESRNAYLTAAGTIKQTNERRKAEGLPELKTNARLNAAASAKVKDMFAGQYFEHISPTGKGPGDLAKAESYEYISVGENLALGNYKDDSVLVEAWMNSPGHRANILNAKFSEIGVAVLRGKFEGHTTWLAVQEFGRPVTECPRVDTFLKAQIDSGKIDIDSLEAQVKAKKQELEGYPEPKNQEEVDAYNQKVQDYNALVKVYNNRIDTQKVRVSGYNAQVKAFNECVGN